MAWYALYKWFAPWNKTRRTNWISWYKGYLYEQWFYSLPEKEQQEELNRLRRKKKKERRESEYRIRQFSNIMNMMYEKSGFTYNEIMKADKLMRSSSKSIFW